MKPSLFIGSSTEGLRIAQQVQFELRHIAESKVWDQGVFGLGWTTIESLMTELDRHDFAILVLSPDDIITSRQSQSSMPRDNVLFELGLFMGRLSPKRSFVLYDRASDLKLLTDLRGLTLAEYDGEWAKRDLPAAVGTACQPIRGAIEQLGKLSLSAPRANLLLTTKEMEAEEAFVDVIESSQDLFIGGVALEYAVKKHRAQLLKQLDRGGKLRLLLLNPNSPDVTHIAKMFEITPEQIRNDILATIRNIGMLKSRIPESTWHSVEVRLSQRESPFSFAISDPRSETGVIRASLRAYGLAALTRPNLIIKASDRWFHILLESCEGLWASSKSIVQKAGVVPYRLSEAGEPEVLLVTARTASRQWIFPVGDVDPGETLPQAAARECHEESGYTINIGPKESLKKIGTIEMENEGTISLMTFFLARVTGQVDEYETDRDRKWVHYSHLSNNVAGDFMSIAQWAITILEST